MLEGVLIAIAISIDSFSVGIAYGIKNIKVPLRSILILDLISVILLSIGFFAGNLISRFLPPGTSEMLGAITIFLIGLWYFIQGWVNYKFPTDQIEGTTSIATFSIKSLGIAINILRSPFNADLDISGEIDTKEAIFLGFALAIDSLAVGIAVTISSFSIIFTTLGIVAIMNLVLLLTGIHLGKQLLATHLGRRTPLIPGIILMTLGLLRFF